MWELFPSKTMIHDLSPFHVSVWCTTYDYALIKPSVPCLLMRAKGHGHNKMTRMPCQCKAKNLQRQYKFTQYQILDEFTTWVE